MMHDPQALRGQDREPWPLPGERRIAGSGDAAPAFTASERDTTMSFQQKQPANAQRYMQQLDLWTSEHVVGPLVCQGSPTIQKAIRDKVLESYRNGQKGTR